MAQSTEDWEARIADLWATIDKYGEEEFRARVGALAGELPPGDPVADFERAAAHDSTGHPHEAIELYDKALAAGLTGIRRRRAVIQSASSLRNLGEAEQALERLIREAGQPSDELDGAVATFTALVLADLGREREALSLALGALADYLPRYNRSVAHYAAALVDDRGSMNT